MNDRQLLELAARALGIGAYVYCDTHMGMIPKSEDDYVFPFNVWNPLADDGDALRLAVMLGIHLHFEGEGESEGVWANETLIWVNSELAKGDRMHATREAIVSVAAEIGRLSHG